MNTILQIRNFITFPGIASLLILSALLLYILLEYKKNLKLNSFEFVFVVTVIYCIITLALDISRLATVPFVGFFVSLFMFPAYLFSFLPLVDWLYFELAVVFIAFPLYFILRFAWIDKIPLSLRYAIILMYVMLLILFWPIGAGIIVEQLTDLCFGLSCPIK